MARRDQLNTASNLNFSRVDSQPITVECCLGLACVKDKRAADKTC
jgi:hypothetical protein